MKTAVIQLNSINDKKTNIAKALKYINHAVKNKSQFILLPEFFTFRNKKNTGKKKQLKGQIIFESLGGETITVLSKTAKKNKVHILAGSIYEKAEKGKKGFNTSVLINDCGKINGIYRKINLFDAVIDGKKIREEKFFQKGKNLFVGKIKDFNVALSLCYDLRFPELYKKYVSMGANVLCVPSSFAKKTGEAHWEILLRARAIENLCYVVAPNQVGEDSLGVKSYGNSMIIDPWGKILARASANKEEVIYAELNINEIIKARNILPGI